MAGPSALWNGGRSRPPRHHPSGVARSDAARYVGTNPSGEAMRRETSSADRLSAQSWANAAAALIIAALLPTATSAAEPVAVFTGTGDGTTPAFAVEDGWEARWTAAGHGFEPVLTGASLGVGRRSWWEAGGRYVVIS